MEREDDVQLIRRVLSGDDTAFDSLVVKYQKSVHALVWQKIGDFHHAEELTQDAFLQAYSKLSTLKDPHQFSGWLYVIAKRLCIDWLRKQKPAMQSLEETSVEEIDDITYERYMAEDRELEVAEQRQELVKKLLEQLSESEREVLTLYYLSEMTTPEISKFLGVPVKTIGSRLRRARARLKEKEARFIQEYFAGVEISGNIREHIARQVADMQPTPSPKMKPFLPWVAIGTAVVVVTLLMLSVSTPYLPHVQELYSTYFARDTEGTKDERRFAADFTLTLGTHRRGVDLLDALMEEKIRISEWSAQILKNPEFPVVAAEMMVEIVVVSMLELGFAEGELASVATICERARQMGLETCPAETAAQLRLQFRDQPDWTTGERLSGFFVASEPLVLTREGLPKIFSVVADDRYAHPDTGVSLWLIANGTVDASSDAEDPGRLFNASDPEGLDLRGRFAFVIPK